MLNFNVDIQDCIIPMYDKVLEDILNHGHVHYTFPGGRGSTKSSFVGIVIPLLVISNPGVHAACFRKIGNTIQNSIRTQIEWGIGKLGLTDYFLIPKAYQNPIIFKPTGQKIYFLGLDNPQKVKSIKPSFGYIGITWFEELDQFSGENEIRSVTQSTMRGGDKYWDFRTFNPPISKNNWANVYADKASGRARTLVVRNNYLDVPRIWLGDEFIEEAEDLKAVNPRAYEHEYLGIATGTGGDVFENACDLRMSNQMVAQFDHIYNGIDWGFARDPFRYVRMHFDAKKLDLYIFDEFTSYKTRNEDNFNRLYVEEKKISRSELVTADSAEEKSIADFKAYGAFIRPAKKGPDSVRYGIKWLQGLRHIYIDKKRCPETYYEFVNYEYERDRDGNFISAYPDENNHSIDACLLGNTKIFTSDGYKKIEDMVGTEGTLFAYDINTKTVVETEYIHCRLTFENAQIYKVWLLDGRFVECTDNHRILTSNRGYVMAGDLTTEDTIVCIDEYCGVKFIEKTNKILPVYDLEVPIFHNFVLSNGIVVHNCRYALETYANRRGH